MRLIDADELLDITVTVADEKMAEFTQNQSFTYRELVAAETTRRFFEAITTIIADAPTAYDMERYKWHDLRKNPYDLPEHDKDVIFCDTDRDLYLGSYSEANSKRCMWLANGQDDRIKNVIAWRFIKPLEEET